MSSTPNGSGLELEKFPDAPPKIAINAPADTPDAGLRSLDHYKRKLPQWRYDLRQQLLPLIRWETPYLAWMQDKMRSPALDSYFAITANLGTHTFFMVVLPILFWCGHTSLGRGMVHILASGVFFTGFIKDMVSLPRPLSPPLQRITMSGSAALEYGFPSTHSANAVSVAVYALFTIHSPDCQLQQSTKLILEIVSYSYAFSIILGRLYCGMHGFLDVIVGSIIGAGISVIECVYGAEIDRYLHSSSWLAPATIALVIIVLIRIHPEPADDCPCFDDSVAFAGVMIGIEIGGWHYASGNWAWDIPVPATVPFSLQHMGWVVVIARVLIGVLVIFAWREVMKPAMLKFLPHLFRIIEQYGLSLPRKFFMPASEYKNIPSRLKVDNVMPSVSDLPGLLTSIRHPGRGRAVSVGPQSAADAYETLAYREKRRRDSLTNTGEMESGAQSPRSTVAAQADYFSVPGKVDKEGAVSQVSGISAPLGLLATGNLPTPAQSRVGSYEQMMGQGHVLMTPSTPPNGLVDDAEDENVEIFVGQQNELGEKEMFSRLEKPRVRYDVEVVTKLVVYTGIGWLAVEFNPIIFEVLGLGMGNHRPF
ncbi:sphingosine-1-phosphate phosphohydrolase-like protein [Mollisia scopiformis]|uniref:Sphingosine-1-phosphate phosphohydrolase-like protein n=1 Tax=Mollisia scopiformis TaxID=149040 RepID=A0A194XTZ9_MOLSC|nr:sphingosine-1-phosphate phosphohydrolase-like protein [Mollisia scopiformis]KUJ23182.1 sphingosine-1-phosphate phosphohydrolase-like protein [Mollisia scopiformis]